MKILGVDPGTSRLGWAIIESEHKPRAIAYGCIESDKHTSTSHRLLTIHNKLSRIIVSHKPDVASVEELFFSTNAKTAISVGEARGVILLVAAQHQLPVTSYTPNTVKRTVCGTGSAQKSQIQHMVKSILGLNEIPKPDDAADALAIALTHAFSYKMKHLL